MCVGSIVVHLNSKYGLRGGADVEAGSCQSIGYDTFYDTVHKTRPQRPGWRTQRSAGTDSVLDRPLQAAGGTAVCCWLRFDVPVSE